MQIQAMQTSTSSGERRGAGAISRRYPKNEVPAATVNSNREKRNRQPSQIGRYNPTLPKISDGTGKGRYIDVYA
ncbi:MAG: hypothetical protein J1F64_10500 [Oscillospiraceae bacterium]|nr:hypothetical protein [Oscillospiraceae bacterium]